MYVDNGSLTRAQSIVDHVWPQQMATRPLRQKIVSF